MNNITRLKTALILAALASAISAPVHAQVITNGGFESGLAGWTTADQLGSDGTFFAQTGTTTPLNAFTVPAPPEGIRAAMTDAGAGGTHVLYQDFTVPSSVTLATVGFSLYLNNAADAYFAPANLDWAATNQAGGQILNQQARVDILTTAADPFSVAAGSVLQNLFQTTSQTPLVTDYNPFVIDITALLQAHQGQTLRLRFAETDNINFFNLGVDNVNLSIVPEPATCLMALGAMIGVGALGDGIHKWFDRISESDPASQATKGGVEAMQKNLAAGVILCSLLIGVPAGAAVIHDEAVNGDISGDRFHPTTYTLAPGVNSVIATTSANDLEYITLIVPVGYRLASLVLASYVSDNGIAFIGVQAGTTFTEDPSNPDVANLLGWAHFGTDFGNIGQDILDDMGTAFGVIGFTPPLPAGPYTYWIQQFDFDLTTYQFDFVVEPVPQVPGDMNHDGTVTAADVPGFVAVLLAIDNSPAQVAAADVNLSGSVNGADIAPFEEALIP